jgi:hypothetical protein
LGITRETPEGRLKKQVLEYLTRKNAWYEVLVTSAGALPSGKYVRHGTPGRADIVCFPWSSKVSVVWIETKVDGKHTDEQKAWSTKCYKYGHYYILCKKLEDLYPIFGGDK